MDKFLYAVTHNRLLVLLGGILLLGAGVIAWVRLPIDAFPDVSNNQVMVLTEAAGYTPGEIERLITFPIETQMGGLPGVMNVRSLSKTGLSQVVVIFEDSVDTYFARQLVLERLLQAREKLPEGIEPEMGPISTGLGEIYQYIVEAVYYCPEHREEFSREPGTCRQCKKSFLESEHGLAELRTIQDWLISPQLRKLPGINEVNSFGGYVKQYHIIPDPELLIKYDITVSDILEAVEKNNANTGGGYIIRDWEQINVMTRGLVQGIPDIGMIVLNAENGTPVYLNDVAKVEIGHQLRNGAVTCDGRGEAVIGMTVMLKGANSKTVVDRVKKEIPAISKSLPPGVILTPFYDRTDLIQACISTVSNAIFQGGILVIVILFLLLWDLRAALTVTIALPLTAAATFLLMSWQEITANLMSLGGLVIAIGVVVNGSIFITENIVRHMREHADSDRSRSEIAWKAAAEVARPAMFSILIVIVVFAPLFTLESLEGKMFKPLAITMIFALLSSIGAALTVVPALASLIVKRKKQDERKTLLQRLHHRIHAPLLSAALRHRWLTIAGAAVLTVGTALLVPQIGTEFLPSLDEGAIAINMVRLPTAGLDGSAMQCLEIERRLLEKFPEVITVVSKTGRAEIAEDPMGPEQSDIFIMLKPVREWATGRTKNELIEEISAELDRIPGIRPAFSQPIELRVNELISGIKSDIAVKVFGDDIDVLQETADKIAGVLSRIRGARDTSIEQISGFTQIEVHMDREAIARHKLNVSDINLMVETAIGGKTVSEVFEGRKRFGILVRFPEKYRRNPENLEDMLVSSPLGYKLPLKELISIQEVEVPAQISRENSQRRLIVQCNVRDRDIGGFVNEVISELAVIEKGLPSGYRITYGGQFENQQRAMARLKILVPVSIALILFLLFSALRSVKSSLVVLINLPFALIGGVMALYFLDIYFSVAASIGFIALFGVAVEDALVLISFTDTLRAKGMSLKNALTEACRLRVRPMLMTTLTTLAGLIPMLYATGAGSEIQKPLVAVVFGGLVSSLFLELIVLPVVYAVANGFNERQE